jgi:hypothetical protein
MISLNVKDNQIAVTVMGQFTLDDYREFEQAVKDYTDSPAQKEWYKIYLPLRGQSTTHDITN